MRPNESQTDSLGQAEKLASKIILPPTWGRTLWALLPHVGGANSALQHAATRIHRLIAQPLFDSEKLVVLREAIGAGERARFDLPAIGGDREVGNGRVFRFARAMGHDCAIMRAVGRIHGVKSLAQGANLVDLYEDRIADMLGDAFFQARRIGDEDIVADELHLLS